MAGADKYKQVRLEITPVYNINDELVYEFVYWEYRYLLWAGGDRWDPAPLSSDQTAPTLLEAASKAREEAQACGYWPYEIDY